MNDRYFYLGMIKSLRERPREENIREFKSSTARKRVTENSGISWEDPDFNPKLLEYVKDVMMESHLNQVRLNRRGRRDNKREP